MERVKTLKKETFSLTREFSHLGKFQQAYTLCYSLQTGEQGLTVSVTKTQDAQQETQKITLVSWQPEEAKLLVRYLYENAIPMENWQDIVADMTVALTPRKE